ncbi:MAG: TIGR00730 family Rossman fold protein [Prevotella sp.]|nr:TIGR00730 family Rossman fold protein [Prevotella sp.]
MNICIFCSANEQIDPDLFAMTEELGRWLATRGYTIVFGGNDSGLMHAVSRAAREAGGRLIGVVPRVIEERGKLSPYLDVHIPTDNLSDRKDLMTAQADAFIALPGGIGTLDEIFTVASSGGLGYHHKPLILYNMKGFWNSLLSLLDDLQQRGMMRGQWHDAILVASSLDELSKILDEHLGIAALA